MSSKQRQEESVKDLMQCAICMNSFKASGLRVPKMLSCQHSFCTACLRNIAQGTRIQCPICRREFDITVDQLPKSLLLMQLIDRAGTTEDDDDEPDHEDILRRLFKDPSNAKTALKSLDEEIQKSGRYSRDRLELVLQCMNYHRSTTTRNSPDILVAATACLYRLVSNGGLSVPIELLGQVANDVTLAVEAFKEIRQLQINGFAILGNDGMLIHSSFDFFKTTNMALEALDDETTENNALQILSNVPRRLSRDENGSLGTNNNIKKLLRILDKKLSSRTYNNSLTWILEALMGMTDETPATCFSIVSENGLDQLTKLLKEKDIEMSFKSDALITLNNLSEVSQLREQMIKCKSLGHTLQELLRTDTIRISFITAGIVAQLSTVPKASWMMLTGEACLRDDLLTELYKTVMSWKDSAEELNIKFRSFNPLYPLLQRYDAPPVQLYASWIICNFCAWEQKYNDLLISEQGVDILLELKDNKYADAGVRELAKKTLEAIH